jgi:hypothetical protein
MCVVALVYYPSTQEGEAESLGLMGRTHLKDRKKNKSEKYSNNNIQNNRRRKNKAEQKRSKKLAAKWRSNVSIK